MLKKPDNKSLIILTIMFLIGVAMVFIPLIQQRQEIEDDNNIYAMIAEEIRHQQALSAVPAEDSDSDDLSAEETPAEESEPVEEPSEESVKEPSAENLEDEPIAENTQSEESELPVMIVEEVQIPEETESLEATSPVASNQPVTPTKKPSLTSEPTKKPESTVTKPPSAKNKDYIAWISIPGTVIDYPVVRSSRTEYYLHHMINGQESKLGCLFSLPTSDYQTPSKNIAIYGHHLSNSTAMFSTLMNYKREDYWRSHQTIQLDTIYGKRTYRIFAVINHTVSDWDASTASFKDDEAFLKFVNRAKRKAFYDTGIEVSESDHILTLITCDRSFGGVQGRLLVMGVEQ